VVVIAIKPYQIESVIKPIADEFAKNGRFVVSIAAGWDLAKYQKLFGDLAQSIHIQCTIPNTPMAVGKGVLVTETDNTLTDMQTEVFESLFGPISLIERVDTAHMTIAMVVAGCAPAFTDMYIEALGDAGVQYGNLSDAVAASDVVTVATIDRMKQADGDQQDLYDMTLKSGRVSRGLWKVVISRSPSILDAKERGQGRFHREIWCGDQDHCPARQTDDGAYQLSNLTQGIRRYDDTAFKECRTP